MKIVIEFTNAIDFKDKEKVKKIIEKRSFMRKYLLKTANIRAYST